MLSSALHLLPPKRSLRSTYLTVLLPNFRMLSTQHFAIKISIVFRGYCPCVRLSSNFYALVLSEGNVFNEAVLIKGVEV